MGLDIRTTALVLLCLQLTALAIVLHVSQTKLKPGQAHYRPSSAVLFTELGKLFVSLCLSWFEVGNLIKCERRDALAAATSPSSQSMAFTNSDISNSSFEEQQGLLSKEAGGDSALLHEPRTLSVLDDPLIDWHRAPLRLSVQGRISRIKEEYLSPDLLTLSIPAIFFTLQNNAQYFAAANLSVPAFQVSYQLKIPSTAVFAVLLLGRALTRLQWLAIAVLPIGVVIIQLAGTGASTASVAHHISTEDKAMNPVIGMAAVLLACLSSGFSGCYFERRLKAAPPNGRKRKTGLWIRNIQLATFGVMISTTVCASEYSSALYAGTTNDGFVTYLLTGFGGMACVVLAMQIAGGLLAALAIKYADNVSKAFSASASIVLSFIASVWFFGYTLSLGVLGGSCLVVGATWLFSWESIQAERQSKQLQMTTRTKEDLDSRNVTAHTAVAMTPISNTTSPVISYGPFQHNTQQQLQQHQRLPSYTRQAELNGVRPISLSPPDASAIHQMLPSPTWIHRADHRIS